MGILKVLLARTCIPLCLIQVLKFESNQLTPSDVIILHLLATFTIVWTKDVFEIVHLESKQVNKSPSRIFSGTAFIFSMLTAFWLTHFYFVKGHADRKYLLIDYGFPCINFKYILQWTYYEVFNLFLFVYNFLKHLGVRPVNIVCYLLYLAMHATVVVFIMEFITLSLMTDFYLALKDNFYYTFDANTSDAYPKGYLNPLILDKGLYDKATMTTEFYTCPSDIFGTCTLSWRKKDVEDAKFPLEHKMIYRYIGEDVEMTCDYTLTPSTTFVAKSQPTVWFLNDSVVKNSSRHFVYDTYYEVAESVVFKSTLKVRFLKDTDFGEYICSNSLKSSSYVEDHLGFLAEEYTITKPSIQVFVLNEIKVQPKLIYRVVGNIITSENYFWYHTDADLNDMSITYTINDRPVDEVCHGFQAQTCSIGASILRNFIRVGAQNFDWNGAVEFPFIDIGDLWYFGLKRGIIYFCLCSSGYGIHRISFLRKVYSGLTKKYKNEEIVHPFVFIVLPLSTISLFRIFNDTHLYDKIEDLLEKEENFNIIEDAVDDLIGFITANEEKVLTIANFIQGTLLITCVIFLYALTLGVSNIYLQLCIEYVPRRVFIPQYMFPGTEPVLALEGEEYDIFISSSDEEYLFVRETLLSLIENDCDKRVCLADRDITPNRSIFSSYVDKIRKSHRVIVLLSHAYMTDAKCRLLQLEHIILPLIYEQTRTPKDILVIKYDEDIIIPDVLKWNSQIKVFPWSTYLPEQVKLSKLKQWVLTGNM